MATIEELLQFHIFKTTLKQSAEQFFSDSIKRKLKVRVGNLIKIRERLIDSQFGAISFLLIPDVVIKFKVLIENNNIEFNKRELRTLTFALTYPENNPETIFNLENELKIALSLLDKNWNDNYLVGLIDCFLSKWDSKNKSSLEQIEKFINQKLENYSGTRDIFLSFKNNKRFFNIKNGDLLLGDAIAKLNKPIQEATKILGVPDSWITYPYFSRVIITYYDRNQNDTLKVIDSINQILNTHKLITTKKIVVPKIVLKAANPNNQNLKEQVKKIALEQLNDPQNKGESLWGKSDDISNIETSDLLKAKEIVLQWLAEEFIEFFFKECINDSRRKKFWIKYASKISSFKVYGPLTTGYLLKRNETISKYVDGRFVAVTSKKDVSAFILYIKDYMIIEFSNEGYACYVYKINSKNCPSIKSKLNSVDDLRNSNMSSAISSDADYYYHSDEGRLFHRDGNDTWETKFNNWINQKIFK